MKKFLFLGMTAAVLSACSPTVNKRGNMVDDFQLKQVTPGVHTRTDVLKIMGSPTTMAPFDDNLWYYIGQETEKRGILDEDITAERIIAVKFDEQGNVMKVQEMKNDRLAIPIERDKTPTHGNQLSFTQQLLGNLGKFNTPDTNKKIGQ